MTKRLFETLKALLVFLEVPMKVVYGLGVRNSEGLTTQEVKIDKNGWNASLGLANDLKADLCRQRI